MFRYNILFLSFSIVIFVFSFSSCKETILDPGISEEEVIGTWVLTKITASYPSGKKASTPQEENLAVTITLNNDRTFQRDQNIQGKLTNDSGKWNLTNGILRLISANDTYNFPCSLNGNILLTGATIIDPENGNFLPLTLEFTRQAPDK